tara:strand:+ start:149 stop:685 length:537 start_codon:yes stop_codon:yes gene_type:complete
MIFTYFSFFHKKNQNSVSSTNDKSITSQNFDNETGSKIDDIYYISKDENGNSYEIVSEFGELDQKNSDVIKLKSVTATINIENSGKILVSSKNALYNRVNLNTYFYGDVSLKHDDHRITSDNMDMDYVNKDIKISGNVVYLHDDNSMNADIVEIDMLTKVSKIYMKDKTEKIKALIIN